MSGGVGDLVDSVSFEFSIGEVKSFSGGETGDGFFSFDVSGGRSD